MGAIFEKKNGKGILIFSGNLTIYEILDIQKEMRNFVKACETLEIDLSGVVKCDTAGIQSLLSLARSAISEKKQLTVIHVSDVVTRLANQLAIHLDKSISIEGV